MSGMHSLQATLDAGGCPRNMDIVTLDPDGNCGYHLVGVVLKATGQAEQWGLQHSNKKDVVASRVRELVAQALESMPDKVYEDSGAGEWSASGARGHAQPTLLLQACQLPLPILSECAASS